MDKTLNLFIIVVCMNLSGFGQPRAYLQRPAVGVHASFYDFKGADSIKQFGRQLKTGLTLSYHNHLSRQLDVQATLTGAFLDFITQKGKSLGGGKDRLLLELTAGPRARLLPVHYRIVPFVQAGAGFSKYQNYYGVFIPAGAGLQVNITADIFGLLNTQYRLPVTNTQNVHFYHSIGLAGAIGKKKKNPKRPLPPLPVVVEVPKDADGDGMVDSIDACPQTPGFVRYHGCPVPDKDGDGINDEQDKCPDVPGLIAYQGCPLPDRDKEIPDSLTRRMEMAARNIFFETGKYNLLPTSYTALNEVVKIMATHPHLQLAIEGHTDNAGTSVKNKILSERRAKAVVDYLVQKGIATGRLTANGYGQEKPVADNATRTGRAKNRRVVLVPH
jgi:OmpA-OmpF porin, OOP family